MLHGDKPVSKSPLSRIPVSAGVGSHVPVLVGAETVRDVDEEVEGNMGVGPGVVMEGMVSSWDPMLLVPVPDEEGRAKIPLQAKIMIYRLERIRKQYFMRSLHIREVGSMRSKRLEKMINEFVHQARLEGKSESEIGDLEIKKGKEFGAQVAAWTPTNAITFKKWMESARKTIDEKKHGGCDCCGGD